MEEFLPEVKVVVQKHWEPILSDLSEKASKLNAGKGNAPMLSPAFHLIRASVEFAQQAAAAPDDLDALEKTLKSSEIAP